MRNSTFRHRLLVTLAALFCGAAPVAATAQEACAVVPELSLTEQDANRLAQLADSRARGIAQAVEEGDAEARRTVAAFFEQGLVPADDIAPGRYQCRTVKLGGPFGAFTAYSFFLCEISSDGGTLSIEKLTGSQRFSGDLIAVGGGLVFRGADHYADEEPKAYGDDPERNAVGCVSRGSAGEGSYLLEFPMPFLESLHDVIELKP